MADATYQIGVEALYDNTQLISGVTQAETAIEGLEGSFDEVATSASSSADAIPTAFANTSIGITDSAKKLKGVGKQVGGDVALAVTDGISSGNIVGSFTNIIGSLAAVGGVAAVGIGIGGALINGLIQGWQENKEAFRDSVNGLLGAVEDDFRGSWEDIRKDMRQEFTKIGTLEDLGGEGGLTEGLRQANVFVDMLGIGLGRVTDVLRGKTDPATDRVVDALREMSKETDDVYKAGVKVGEVETARAKKAQELLGLFEAQRGELRQARDDTADLYDLQHNTRKEYELASDAASRLADSTARAADEAQRLEAHAINAADKLLSAADQLNGLF